MITGIWKKFVIAVIFGLIIASQAYAQSIQVTPTSIDFGAVTIGSTDSRTVTVRNNNSEGTFTFNATIGEGSDPSFFISSQPTNTTLGPGQSATFSVGFRPTGQGVFRGSVIVNDSFEESVTIPLSGQGQEGARLQVEPTNINFGTVGVGNTVTRTVTVTNTGRGFLNFSGRIEPGSDPAFFIASQPSTSSLGPGQSASFTVGFRPDVGTPENAFGSISITSNGGNATVRLRATVAPRGALQVNPTTINFGIVNNGETATRTVTVSNTGNGSLTFSVALINGAASGFAISQPSTLTLGPGESTMFDVRFTPSSSNPVGGAVQVTSDFGNAIVRLSGQGSGEEVPPAGTLEVQPTSIDFGNVNLGSSATRTVTLRNAGRAPINLTQVSLTAGSEAGFFIASQPAVATLGPGQSTTFDVGLRPVSAGSEQSSGTVTINSTGGNATVSLRGRGNVQSAPVLEMNPSSLDFGDVLTGESRTLTFTIRNAAGLDAAPLEIGSINVQTVEGLNTFQVTGQPTGSIPPGGSQQISITFSPLEIDPATGSVGQITINSNAGQPVTVTARGRGIVRLSFGGARVVRVREGVSANVTLSLQGRPPDNGLTIPLVARFENGALDLVLDQNLADVLQVEREISQSITFTQANESRTISIVTRDIEIGPTARLSLSLAGGVNPALQLDPITIVLRPDNSPDLLKTFKCGGCQAGFTQEGDTLRVIVAFFDQNADVQRLTLVATNDRGETLVVPSFTPDSVPALPTGSRGFALRLSLVGFGSFGTVRSLDVLVEDTAGNRSSARLPDGPGARTQFLISSPPIQSGDGVKPKVVSIEVLPQP